MNAQFVGDNTNKGGGFDNSYPDNFYPKYSVTLTVPIDATTVKGDHLPGEKTSRPYGYHARCRAE